MMTAAHVKRHIACLPEDKPFSTREFLSYGSRAAIDQVLWRLVQKGIIIRVARGLFIKKDSIRPSIDEVAIAKAAAFGRTLAKHGSAAIRALGLNADSTSEPSTSNEAKVSEEATLDGTKKSEIVLYACNGRTSSFRFGNVIIKLVGTSPRKMNLGDDKVGLVLRALWHYGKNICNMEIASRASGTLNRSERQVLRQAVSFMPYWMPKCFSLFKQKRLQKNKLPKSQKRIPAWFLQRLADWNHGEFWSLG